MMAPRPARAGTLTVAAGRVVADFLLTRGLPRPGAQFLVLYDFPDTKTARELSPNGRVHWGTRNRAQKRAGNRVAVAARAADLRPMVGPVEVLLRYVFPNHGRHDLDNLIAMSKPMLDALVRCEVLPDDDSGTLVDVRAEVVVERSSRRLEILIRPALIASALAGEEE